MARESTVRTLGDAFCTKSSATLAKALGGVAGRAGYSVASLDRVQNRRLGQRARQARAVDRMFSGEDGLRRSGPSVRHRLDDRTGNWH